MEAERCTNPSCGAARAAGPVCPHCGVIYAKAAARVARAAAVAAARAAAAAPPPAAAPLPAAPLFPSPNVPPQTLDPEAALFDAGPATERRLRLFALPAALLLAWLAMQTEVGRMLGRIFFSMWLHELGHAVAAWFCGFHAVPLPWFTPVADERSLVVSALLAAPLAWLARASWRSGRRGWTWLAGALLALQLFCTFGLSLPRARAFFIFFGDAGAMALGTALLLAFYAPASSPLRRNGLRWGLLVIGAVALLDPFEQWVGAAGDADRIPYGQHALAGLSDPSKLTEEFGWSQGGMVRSFIGVGVACLLLLAAAWVRGLRDSGPPQDLTAPRAAGAAPPAAAAGRVPDSRS